MSYQLDQYISDRPVAANAMPAERVTFIKRTYAHVAGAILAFVAIETALIGSGLAQDVIGTIYGSTAGMLIVMLAFIGGGYLAQYWAMAATTRGMQYAGLALYVILQAVIFLPILYIANTYFKDQNVIAKAGILTLGIFAGLTTTVFITKQEFSFLGPILCIVSWSTVALIVCAMLFGFNLGTWFSFAMVGLAAAFIIYDTSNVLHHFRTDQYVGASLQLFASVALLFFYILRIVMGSGRD